MALLHGIRGPWRLSGSDRQPQHIPSRLSRTRVRVARSQDKTATAAPKPGAGDAPYIAGPYGSGRLSLDGELGAGCAVGASVCPYPRPCLAR